MSESALDRSKSASAAGEEFLALEGVAIRLGRATVFRNTSWTWLAGERWAILGPDGSGKSSFLEALLGRVPWSHGEMRGPHARKRAADPGTPALIAHVSPLLQRQLATQESSFYQSRWHSGLAEGQRTVTQFLSQESVEELNPFEVAARRKPRGRFLRWKNELIALLGLKSLLPRKLVHLSNGEMRKTLLAHALLKSPRLLILEHPFDGLDLATRKVLHKVIERSLNADTAVMVATNRPEDIPASATHLLIIQQHRIVAQGPKQDMLCFWQNSMSANRPGNAPILGHKSRRADTLGRGSQPPSAPGLYRNRGKAPSLPSASRPLVELHNVTVGNGKQAILRNVTWTLRQGECWALRGPNGAGKTTLLNLIQGDHPLGYALNIRLFGQSPDSTQTLWQMRQQLGWMSPELHQHYPGEWTVLEVVCSGFFNTTGLYHGCSRTQLRQARQWLLDLGLAAHAHRPFGELPFGRQRLALLARAAVKRPRLLILDEPCQGLDAMQRHTLLAALDRIVLQTGCSLIFVTHHSDERPRCLTNALLLKEGRVCRSGPIRPAAGQTESTSAPHQPRLTRPACAFLRRRS